MIKLLLEPVNFLILDEPTNHLDMQSKDVLKEAIKAFDGTAIIVSHDREFLDGLVNKVYAFANGHVREHIGGIYDYLSTVNQQVSEVVPEEPKPETKPEKPEKINYTQLKEQNKRLAKIQRQIKASEERQAELQARLATLDEELCKPENAANLKLVNEYTQLQQELELEECNWLELNEKLPQ